MLKRRIALSDAAARLSSPRRVAAVAATLLVGLGAAGCGSSSSTSSKAPTLTKAEFLAQANAICTTGNQKQTAATKALGAKPTPAQIAKFVTTVFVPGIQSQIDGVRALGARTSDAATVTKMLDVAQADLDKVKSKPSLLAGNAPPFADFAKLAHPYGLTACAAGN